MTPPVAKQIPTHATLFGDTRQDPYAWLRNREDPDTIAYLEAENAHTEAFMEPTKDLQTTLYGEMLGRMQADVIANRPAAMLILAGTNDIARGVALETIQNNISMIGDLAEKHQIKVIIASVLPTSDHHKDKNPRFEMTKGRPLAVIGELNTFLAALCQKRGYTYLNYFDAMKDATGQLKAELADDGLHPNTEGYKVMAPLALAAIEKTLGAPKLPVQQTGKKKRQ